MGPREILLHLIGPAARVAVFVQLADKKLWMPSPCSADEMEGLVEQHIEGGVLPRPVLRRDGSLYEERRASCLGAYCLHEDGEAWRCRWVCFDVDSVEDHARAVADPAGAVGRLVALLEEAGLEPVIERSHGGKGWHVWVLFRAWQPAGFCHWLGLRVRELLSGRYGLGQVEAFPKQAALRAGGGFGNLVALPFPGQPRAVGGGLLHWPDGSMREPGSVRLVEEPAAHAWREHWVQWQARAERAAQQELRLRARQQRQVQARPAGRGAPERDTPITCTLEETARAIRGLVTEEVGGVLLCNCPRHDSRSQRSLHVEPGRGWVCRACYQGDDRPTGGGDVGAGQHPWSLVRWCHPEWSGREIGDFLRSLSRGRPRV